MKLAWFHLTSSCTFFFLGGLFSKFCSFDNLLHKKGLKHLFIINSADDSIMFNKMRMRTVYIVLPLGKHNFKFWFIFIFHRLFLTDTTVLRVFITKMTRQSWHGSLWMNPGAHQILQEGLFRSNTFTCLLNFLHSFFFLFLFLFLSFFFSLSSFDFGL